jgi:hypothetical protein
MDEDIRNESKTGTKVKMHAIVNRKCQNLLTSIFAGEKSKFQKLLFVKVENTRDAIAVDEAFDRYENLKSGGIGQADDKKVNDFLKGILKVGAESTDRLLGEPHQQFDHV